MARFILVQQNEDMVESKKDRELVAAAAIPIPSSLLQQCSHCPAAEAFAPQASEASEQRCVNRAADPAPSTAQRGLQKRYGKRWREVCLEVWDLQACRIVARGWGAFCKALDTGSSASYSLSWTDVPLVGKELVG